MRRGEAGAVGRRGRSGRARGGPAKAVAFGDVKMLPVPWAAIDGALAASGSLAGNTVIDTTNQSGPDGPLTLPGGPSAAPINGRPLPEARPVKANNTLTAGFQAEAAGRPEGERVALFEAGEDAAAKATVAGLIADSGFVVVDVGGWAEVRITEAPRRPGSVHGEEYRPGAARAVAEAVRRDPTEAGRLAREARVAG